jgi:molybdopterin molybdotransferase
VKLLPVEEARARMLARVGPPRIETVPLAQAVGRVLAQAVDALRDQPPFPASAMDGYAVRAAETPGRLTVVGESAAGAGFAHPLGPGQAVRIFTGAAVPDGADAIVIQEDARREGEAVEVPQTPAGNFVRPRGGDFQQGTVLLEAGQRIDPWRLSLAASAGRAELAVARRPRVALLSTGEEIVEAPATPGPFQIFDSGTPALAAMIDAWGGEPVRLPPVGDDLEAITAAIAEVACDLLVTVGGASVGDHDLVRAAGEALGLTLDVASIAVRPGKPTFFGRLGDGRLMLGLPGNPASAFVCAELFLRPLLSAWQGASADLAMIPALSLEPLPANGPREHWMRARLSHADGQVAVRPYRDQDSSLVTVFAAADALLRRPPGAPAVAAGEPVDVLPLARG